MTAFFLSFFLLFLLLAPMCSASATTPHPPVAVPHPVKLHDIKDVIALPAPVPWWYWLGGALVVLFGVVLTLWLLKRQKKEKNPPSAGEQALAALSSTRALMSPDQSRAFAVQVAEILRTYIEQRFHVFRPNLTTREFLQSLTRQADMKDSPLLAYDSLLKNWLNHCDMVKFARYRLTEDEMKQMLAQVRQFIETTTKADTPENGGRKK
ncbi:MAG TPA: DUF4381 domain-containing protein [Desulfobulbaceae bacterium]|nr:DUF4381 domain-containing protein [Desulfobulbaceae bacterium]